MEKKADDGPSSSGGSDPRATSGNKNPNPNVGNMNGMTGIQLPMNGMSGIQLPFPFFPPFGCDTICQPIQLQIFQQQPQRKPFTIIVIRY